MFNVVKHAGVKHARVELKHNAETVRLAVEDHGNGFPPQTQTAVSEEGLGLFGVRERLRHHGGSLNIQSEPGRITRVEAAIPLNGTQPGNSR